MAAIRPPVARQLVLAALDESLSAGGDVWPLGAQRFPAGDGAAFPGVVHPDGPRRLEAFERFPFPRQIWQAGPHRLERRVIVIHGCHAVLLRYRRLAGDGPLRLTLRPWTAFRDHHDTRTGEAAAAAPVAAPAGRWRVALTPPDGPPLLIEAPHAAWTGDPVTIRSVLHDREAERGLDDRDDFHSAGRFDVDIAPGGAFDLLAGLEGLPAEDPDRLERRERTRRVQILKPAAGRPAWERMLHLAADQFLVRRGDAGKTIVAGYPWFTDWGRDSMIALPGLCFVTGRVEEGGEILSTFAARVSDGLLPNHFPDAGEEPVYNTLDASLWYFQAVRHYLAAGGRLERVRRDLYGPGREILDRYQSGTRYNIHVSDDGLVSWDWPETALTWMDAKVDDWAATPRTGQPVEIQALWHGALLEMAALAERFRDVATARRWRRMAALARRSFRKFWNGDANYLHDRWEASGPDSSIRPNALFAVSLPYELLPRPQARAVVETARRRLYTPVGLRSLAPDHPDYRPVYVGTRRERDAAYHQGTVWGWLLGPFLEAVWRTAGDPRAAAAEVRETLAAAARHLAEDGLGTFAEVFDGDPPHTPRGCPAQAWSVAELLRIAALVDGRAIGRR